jgi:hypothetical protein
MPFDYASYQEKCNGMTAEQLQKEWENYTRQISSGATSTATSILLMPLTAGISAVGLGISAPRIHNARKKREIIEAGLRARGTTHHTRTGDVLAPMAVSGIIGGLTLGLVPPGASDFAALAAGRAVEIAATNTALTATEAVVVDNARKKMAKEAALQDQFSPEQKTRYGSMPMPFLIEQSVLAFEHPIHHQQPNQPIHPDDTSPAVVQFDSLDDISDLHEIEEVHMLKMHALALAMEKHEGGTQPVEPAQGHVQPQAASEGCTDQGQMPGSITTNQTQPLPSGDEDKPHSGEVSRDATNHSNIQELRPRLPQRQGAHSSPLPARFESPHIGPDDAQHAQISYYPSQQLPPYQPQYLPPTHQFVEPQQYCQPTPLSQQRQDSGYGSIHSSSSIGSSSQQRYHSPPTGHSTSSTPPQQRQDTGYVSMYSTPSMSSTPPQTYYPPPMNHATPPMNGTSSQIYYPPPDFVSRHSSIPESYQNASMAHIPAPYHPADPSFNNQNGTAAQGHRSSESSFYPMTPPPPYYPPPSGMTSAPAAAGKANDYFTHPAVPRPQVANMNLPPQAPFDPLLQQSQKLVDGMNKGWQWARAVALPPKMPTDSKKFVEPNYGPPPAVPTAWKGS